jgi:hypothetical protein
MSVGMITIVLTEGKSTGGEEDDESVECWEGEFVDEEEEDDNDDDDDDEAQCGYLYHSSIRSNLENAEMHRKAPQEGGSENIEERFLITLV